MSDVEMFADLSERLAAAAEASLPAWFRGAVASRAGDRAGELAAAAAGAGDRCASDLAAQIRALTARDVDEQRSTPLAILRTAGGRVAAVLAEADVPPPRRDPFDERANPDDRYDVGPATWADLGPEVAELGIAWGAAKAHLHLRRHGSR